MAKESYFVCHSKCLCQLSFKKQLSAATKNDICRAFEEGQRQQESERERGIGWGVEGKATKSTD